MAEEAVLTPGRGIVDEVHVPVAEKVVVHEPFVPSSVVLPEFSLRAVVVGSILGVIFGASSVYLALKVGLTVSASIPIAVMSISIFRAFGRASILENNIAQTTGSAGESIAAGVVFTIPALLDFGLRPGNLADYHDCAAWRLAWRTANDSAQTSVDCQRTWETHLPRGYGMC